MNGDPKFYYDSYLQIHHFVNLKKSSTFDPKVINIPKIVADYVIW